MPGPRPLPAPLRRLSRRLPRPVRAPLREIARAFGLRAPEPPRAPAGPLSELSLRPVKREGDQIRHSAVLRLASGKKQLLSFWVPRCAADAVTDRADPFVLAALHYAMADGAALHVRKAAVSPSLLRNLEEFQRAWASWRPEYLSAVPLFADQEAEARHVAPAAITAFSGGVDSTYTVYRHLIAPESPRERPLCAGMMMHGFDIHPSDREGFAGALARAHRIAADLDFELIPVRTNFGFPQPQWVDGQGLYLAAALTLLSGRFGAGLISSTGTYDHLVVPWGSNPVTDWMLGSKSFEIVHYGTAASYFDKVRALAAWPAARDNLRFCWEGPQKDRNCGRCRKCVQVGLIFRSAGVPAPFDEPLDVEVVCEMLLAIRDDANEFSHWTMELILAGVEEQGIAEPWVELIRRELPNFRVPAAGA
jgi:hypothetical protein